MFRTVLGGHADFVGDGRAAVYAAATGFAAAIHVEIARLAAFVIDAIDFFLAADGEAGRRPTRQCLGVTPRVVPTDAQTLRAGLCQPLSFDVSGDPIAGRRRGFLHNVVAFSPSILSCMESNTRTTVNGPTD